MPNLKIMFAASAIALVAAAGAGAAPMSDVQYFEAQRCGALVTSPALGKGDSHAIEALIRQQERSRSEPAIELGQEARQDAARQARSASGDQKAKLVAERDGVCQTMVSGDNLTSTR
jgi:hypothetical protein